MINIKNRIGSSLLGLTILGGAAVFTTAEVATAPPAEAMSYAVVEPGTVYLGNNGYYSCRFWFAGRDGATITNWRSEPRLQEKIVEPQRRYYRKAKYAYFKQWGRTKRRLVSLPGWVYPPPKVHWVTFGGLADQNEVKRTHNSRVSSWRGGGSAPSHSYVFSRRNEPGAETLRCVNFFSARATDRSGGWHKISTPAVGYERAWPGRR